MPAETSTKALLIAIDADPAPCVATINRLNPEHLCFFIPEALRPKIETDVQPNLAKLPKKWDWIITPDPHGFGACYKALNQPLADLLKVWGLKPGELTVDLSRATAAMAAATGLASLAHSSQFLTLKPALVAGDAPAGELVIVNGTAHTWQQDNPWTEAAITACRQAAEQFNKGSYASAAATFRHIEARVSGGQKPLYHAFADLADAYGCWDRFQYKPAWESLKTAVKALDMASVFGGPSGIKTLIPRLKENLGFLEKLVMDPAEVKAAVAPDLLANARRRAEQDRAFDAALLTAIRALEAFAQVQLFKQHKIKAHDVQPDQLPAALQEICRTCYLDDVGGKYKLPLVAQFRALAGLGDQMGQAYLAQWPQMKPLMDAAHRSPLGHGFEPAIADRYHQFYALIVKVTGVSEASLPRFPTLNL
ncbi:MAG: TIGR02710 family CRISPR-associated protein [Nitrospirae bacterium]|nr:TIGR02710 family CRISPR-associated protein [Nitrospirota bacterium]